MLLGRGQIVEIEARAKVNLALDIVGAKDGMHLIDTIIVPIDMSDTIQVCQSSEFSVAYSDGRVYKDDTALKAAKHIAKIFGMPPVQVRIIKRIPEGSGLGGSSADAAGVAHAMGQLFGLSKMPYDALIAIGSDVPAMYAGRPVRARGCGESIVAADIKELYFVLLTSDCKVSTRQAYELYDKIGGDKADIEGFLSGTSPAVNALERAAIALAPKIKEHKKLLQASGLSNVVMTGSGSGIVGFTSCPNEYQAAKEYISSRATKYGVSVGGYKTT